MQKYPQVAVRLKAATKLRLQALAQEKSEELKRRVTPSDLVQACIECLITEPACQARKKIAKGSEKG
jgi:hypothetical protein